MFVQQWKEFHLHQLAPPAQYAFFTEFVARGKDKHMFSRPDYKESAFFCFKFGMINPRLKNQPLSNFSLFNNRVFG